MKRTAVVSLALTLAAAVVSAQVVKVKAPSDTSVPTGELVFVPMTEVVYDSGGIADPAAGGVTVTATGFYSVHAQIVFRESVCPNAAGTRLLHIIVNDFEQFSGNDSVNGECVAGHERQLHAFAGVALSAGDTVRVGVWQNSGSTQIVPTFIGQDHNPVLTVIRED